MDIVTRFLADTTQMQSAEQQVKKVGTEAQKTGEKVKKLGSNMRLTKGPTSALSTTAGQLGVQIQDVAVQAQMGTDAIRISRNRGRRFYLSSGQLVLYLVHWRPSVLL